MKRFYREATVAPVADGWGVALDGRPVRTPGRAVLAMPSRALADSVAAEWSAQVETVRPETMPLMQLAATAQDRVAPDPAAIVAALLPYAESDVVCYRVEAPADLAALQAERWDGLLAWFAERTGQHLVATVGAMPVPQPGGLVEALRPKLLALDQPTLTGLQAAVATTGSLVIGWALAEGALDAGAAHRAANLDALWQAERWGLDDEAGLRFARLAAELDSVERFLALARSG